MKKLKTLKTINFELELSDKADLLIDELDTVTKRNFLKLTEHFGFSRAEIDVKGPNFTKIPKK